MLTQSDTLKRALDALRAACDPVHEHNAPSRLLMTDSDAWRAPFIEWLDSTCVRDPRAFGNLSKLHLSYCEWEIARDGVPCTRDVFRALLSEACFPIHDVFGTELVGCLILRDDWEAVWRIQ